MKKIILPIVIVILMFSLIVFGREETIKTDDLKDKNLLNNESNKIINYYSDKIEGATGVKSYKETKDHVIISFYNTDVRVITSKDKFDLMINEG